MRSVAGSGLLVRLTIPLRLAKPPS
jgi:hypothetical protein